MSEYYCAQLRCKAFSGEGVRINKLRVENGELTVWDSVAGYYTACHDIKPRQAKRLIAKVVKHGYAID